MAALSSIRMRAKEILDRNIPAEDCPANIEIRSNNAQASVYTLMTRYTQRILTDNWAKGGLLTGCNMFTGWYAQELKAVHLSEFDVKGQLNKIGRAEAWIPSTSDNRPQYGDILRHTAYHMDVSISNKEDLVARAHLQRAAGGQGGPAFGYDSIRRVTGNKPYDPAKLMGWVDLDILFASQTREGMEWLLGWWEVWDGNYYYYFFYPTGAVQYTKTKPAVRTPPPSSPLNRGRYSYSGSNLVLEWNPLDGGQTVETFRNALPGSLQMNATSNRYSPLVAKRIR